MVVSNQGAVAKGLYGIKDIESTHNRMLQLLKNHNIEILDIFYCPHGSWENCMCRKPMPGMINQAIEKYNIDISNSWMIGDKLSDIEAGNRSNLKSILVETGYGSEEKSKILKNLKTPIYIAKTLKNAIKFIFNYEKENISHD